MGCVHELKTYKKLIINGLDKWHIVRYKIETKKDIVTSFKKQRKMVKLSDSYHVRQKVKNQFGTVYNVIQRFIKGTNKVSAILDCTLSEGGTQASQLLLNLYSLSQN